MHRDRYRCSEIMVQRRSLSDNAHKNKNKAQISSRLLTPKDLISTNVASPVNISIERLKPQIQTLRSFSDPEPSGCTNSLSSCASSAFPARLMELAGSHFDDSMDYKLLRSLLYYKMLAGDNTVWNPFDETVLCNVRCMLIGSMNIDVKTLEFRVTELEQKVRDHMSGKKQIMANKELLLDIFYYVITGQDLKHVAPSPPRANHKKRTSNFLSNEDGGIQNYCCKRSYSESVGQKLPRLMDQKEASEEYDTRATCMISIAAKLQSFCLGEKDMFIALDLLRSDIGLREVLIGLEDKLAKMYLMHVIRG